MAVSYDSNLETSEELSAVNDMLSAIGESPVSTLEGDTNADVANCRRILNQVNIEIQSKGWTFNIEESAVLTPDVFSKLIPYLPSYLRMEAEGAANFYINRGGYVYDRSNKTDQFAEAISVNLVTLKGFEEMPPQFRTYIVAKAARRFNIRFFGAAEIEAFLQEEESDAWRAVQEFELDTGRFNMLDGDNWTSGRLGR
ncbi:phage tail protein [Pseudomonas oryzihabitans]|uniref:phage tail protein n=1 Tax=Pseudomonas oryzihabitans TaxID=47885 RepID=UPI0015E29C2A|nr:phage tail protein [Pseudomonas psychrotolerans]MBA1211533.1 phage tail protein [Pseudomonas psychrotolerans]